VKTFLALAFVLLLSGSAFAQTQIPSGTILPVQLTSNIDSRRIKPGDIISARLMQDVDLGSHHKIPARTQLLGKILSVTRSSVTLSFDQLRVHHQPISIQTNLRSLASWAEVRDAELPTNDVGGEYGSSKDDWNTTQVGGEAVYGRGGPVMAGTRVVGHSLLGGGVVATPEASPEKNCRGDLGNDTPQAFWIFATSACGVYGFDDLRIEHAGRSNPVGVIVLTSPQGIRMRPGTGLLLRVVGE
jgi:hypothetical protein